MTCDAAVSVNKQFTPGKTGIASGTTDNESAGAIDIELSVAIDEFSRNDFLDHFLDNIFSNLFIGDIIIMLRSNDDVGDTFRFTLAVFDGYQCFSVRPQVRNNLLFSGFSQS